MPKAAFDSMQAVAPGAAIIAAAGAYENRRLADERAFALYRRSENFRDAYRSHSLYSAHVLVVSLTLTSEISCQCAWHHSKKCRASVSAVLWLWPRTSLRWRWSKQSSI